MLILILIDVQYSQKAVFSFEKGWNGQNHSSSGSHHLGKKSSPAKFLTPFPPQLWKKRGEFHPNPLLLFGKCCKLDVPKIQHTTVQTDLKYPLL